MEEEDRESVCVCGGDACVCARAGVTGQIEGIGVLG